MNALKENYQDQVDFAILSVTEKESQAGIAKHGLERHGMVLLDKAGKALWVDEGHNQTESIVEFEIKDALGS